MARAGLTPRCWGSASTNLPRIFNAAARSTSSPICFDRKALLMGKHETSYARVERDFYPSPPRVITALAEHVDLVGKHIHECACGTGCMSDALIAAGAQVHSTDVKDYGYRGFNGVADFTALTGPADSFDGIVTNPPFGPRGKLAETFRRPAFVAWVRDSSPSCCRPISIPRKPARPCLVVVRNSQGRSS
jgi:hypothetical protein